MKRIRITLVVVLAGVTLAACDDNSLKQGTVYEKKYHPAHYYYTSQCVASNKNGMCTASVQIPHYAAEWFEVCIKDPNPTKDRHNCITADHDTYENVKVGTGFPAPM